MPPDERRPRHPFERLILIERLSSKRRPTNNNWPDGQVPDRGPAFLCVDGFYSQSYPADQPPFTPLLYALRPTLNAFDASLQTRGFSYSAPNEHYEAQNTNIQLLNGKALQKFSKYLPQPTMPIRYGAFSLGGPLTILALGTWLKTLPAVPSEVRAMVKQVILIQPALTLRDEVRQLVRTAPMGIPVPQPLMEMNRSAPRFEQALLDALDTLHAADISVSMIYWPNDGILNYMDWETRLTERGVTIKRLDDLPLLAFAPDQLLEAFAEHTKVISQQETLEVLLTLLQANDG